MMAADPASTSLEGLLSAGLLLTMRFGSAIVTMPVFSSPGIPARVKATLVLSFAVLLAPVAQAIHYLGPSGARPAKMVDQYDGRFRIQTHGRRW